MAAVYNNLSTPERRDFYDVLADLPPLPSGAVIAHPLSVSRPLAKDKRTGVYYQLRENKWEMADK